MIQKLSVSLWSCSDFYHISFSFGYRNLPQCVQCCISDWVNFLRDICICCRVKTWSYWTFLVSMLIIVNHLKSWLIDIMTCRYICYGCRWHEATNGRPKLFRSIWWVYSSYCHLVGQLAYFEPFAQLNHFSFFFFSFQQNKHYLLLINHF